MGKRKGGKGSDLAAAAARKRARTTLPSSFRCPFCNMMDVAASLKPDEGRARVSCGACGMGYNTVCRTLTEPVDVYHEWLDACEEGLQEEEAAPPPRRQRARTPEAGDGQAGGRGRGGAYGDEELLMPSPEGGDGLLRPSPLHRLRRGDGSGVRDSGGGGGVDDAQRQRRRRLAEGLEETRRGGLQAGAALHDPAAGSLLASRTSRTAAAAPSGPPLPLPAGSLAAMARRQQQQRAAERERRRAAGEEVEEEHGAGLSGSEMGGSGAEGGVYGPGPALVVHTGRLRGGSIDGSMGSGGSGGGAGAGVVAGGTPTKRQSLAAQQQAAARAFADYDD
ncbi:hypothetical protein HYH03_016786 [Edaphochlamys debaryana]|uniref:Transcription elongation factor 1 homolog n=1 Tax=Edaphochlamys debaryana TaxID=47281 RepID=A0A835XNX1_9CHLO|nr:hypothetical protein HYH03_016786 [Edaphochlamys debaryana]|eukprot:KAG2484370.1 hypothetical protein HYH03_016786 [Edaphochlamys debaryana]